MFVIIFSKVRVIFISKISQHLYAGLKIRDASNSCFILPRCFQDSPQDNFVSPPKKQIVKVYLKRIKTQTSWNFNVLCGGQWVCARSLLSCYKVSQKSSDGKLWFYATHEKDKKSVLQITCSIFRDRIQNNVDVTRTTAVRRPTRKTRHRIIVFFLSTAFTSVRWIECILLRIAHETENHLLPTLWSGIQGIFGLE